MADIVFRYVEMRQAADAINGLASQYAATAQSFLTEFNTSVSAWEGESGDKIRQFVSGPVMDYLEKSVPQLIKALAELLNANADQMESADRQIAENIPTSLG